MTPASKPHSELIREAIACAEATPYAPRAAITAGYAALDSLEEQYGTLREALTKAPFPTGHDPDYAYWFHNGRRDALDGSNPAINPEASERESYEGTQGFVDESLRPGHSLSTEAGPRSETSDPASMPAVDTTGSSGGEAGSDPGGLLDLPEDVSMYVEPDPASEPSSDEIAQRVRDGEERPGPDWQAIP